jgi:hypothetical protein
MSRSVWRAAFLTVAVLGVTALTSVIASAAPITFIHTGASGSGSIGNQMFSNQPFTIIATGDTLNRQSYSAGFIIKHTTASIAIGNVGVFTFVTPTHTFFNDIIDVVGFSWATGLDLYDGPVSATLNGWDMLSSIGPVSGNTFLLQWQVAPVITSGGQLIFNYAETTGTFQAVVGTTAIPEPSSMTMFGIAALLLGTGSMVRRRRT